LTVAWRRSDMSPCGAIRTGPSGASGKEAASARVVKSRPAPRPLHRVSPRRGGHNILKPRTALSGSPRSPACRMHHVPPETRHERTLSEPAGMVVVERACRRWSRFDGGVRNIRHAGLRPGPDRAVRGFRVWRPPRRRVTRWRGHGRRKTWYSGHSGPGLHVLGTLSSVAAPRDELMARSTTG